MDLCKIFNVAEDEEFYLRPYGGVYKIHNNLLCYKEDGSSSFKPIEVSVNFVARAVVVKAPFQPENGQTYYTICNSTWEVRKAVWRESPIDYLRKAQDMVFGTYEDAGFACPKIYEKLTGENWDDYDGM